MKKTLDKHGKETLNAALASFNYVFEKKDIMMLEDDRYVWHDNVFSFFKTDEEVWVPTLHILLKKAVLPLVVVDMGAVKFVANGADIMRPGIREVPPGLMKGALVTIADEKNRKPLAVGMLLLDSAALQAAATGKVVKTLHFVGDDIWKKGVS